MLAALINSIYCPMNSLNVIYSNVGRKIQCYILIHCEKLTWKSKIEKKHFFLLRKLIALFFLTQHLSIPRFAMMNKKLSEIDTYLICFTDTSECFSSSCIYLSTADKHSDYSKTQFLTSTSKLQGSSQRETLSDDVLQAVPKYKMFTFMLGTNQLLKATELMLKQDLPISRVIIFVDALSTILATNIHPGRLKSPYNRWLSMANFNLFKIGNLVQQPKESIYLFINQKLRLNLADILTKFHIKTESAQYWNELQTRLLQGSWLVKHPKFWLADVVKESEEKIKTQSKGQPLPLPDFTTDNGKNIEPKQISVKQLSINLHSDPNMVHFPKYDAYIIEAVIQKHMTKEPRISFKIIGWIACCAMKWRDITIIKKKKTIARNTCFHDIIFCRCAKDYLIENQVFDRPFPFDFVIDREEGNMNEVHKIKQVTHN